MDLPALLSWFSCQRHREMVKSQQLGAGRRRALGINQKTEKLGKTSNFPVGGANTFRKEEKGSRSGTAVT